MDAATLEGYSRQTEMSAGGPVATTGGRWRVVAAAFPDRKAAAALNERLRSAGYPAQIADGERGQAEVAVPGLAGEAEARSLATALRNVKGVSAPIVRMDG
jgi:cell division septation protein DedD